MVPDGRCLSGNSLHGDRVGWHETVCSIVVHPARQVLGHRICILVQVSNHGIRMPTAQQFYDISVDTTGEEGHGSSCSKGSGADIRGSQSGGRKALRSRETQLPCNVRCFNAEASSSMVVRC